MYLRDHKAPNWNSNLQSIFLFRKITREKNNKSIYKVKSPLSQDLK